MLPSLLMGQPQPFYYSVLNEAPKRNETRRDETKRDLNDNLKPKPELKEALRNVIEARRLKDSVQDRDSGTESAPFHSDTSSSPQPGTRSSSFSSGYKSPHSLPIRPVSLEAKPAFSQFSVASILSRDDPKEPPMGRFLPPLSSSFQLHASSAFRPLKAEVPPYLYQQQGWAEPKEPQAFSPASSSRSSSPNMGLPPSFNPVCVVCGDKASGYHYGVVSCEGCKGFFRRTVQKQIGYQCHKNGGCPVNRVTRNRCQACRFARCLDMGMSKESVRQDGNRKRKHRDSREEEELQATARTQSLISSVFEAYKQALTKAGEESPVKRFAQCLPGFSSLDAGDQETLIATARMEFDILAKTFDNGSNKENQGELDVYVHKLAAALSQLGVSSEEIALLSAVAILCYTRNDLKHPEAVEKLQEPIVEALRVQVQLRRSQYHHVFAKLLLKLSDIRAMAEGL